MTRVVYHVEARAEFVEAVLWYRERSLRVAKRFATEVERTCSWLLAHPHRGRPFGRRLRRTLVSGFPYGIVYRAEPERIFIVAVMHLRRQPGYLRTRL